MGAGGLSAKAQALGIGARSVEHDQVRPWAMVIVEDARPGFGITLALLRKPGSTEPCRTVRIQFIEPPDT